MRAGERKYRPEFAPSPILSWQVVGLTRRTSQTAGLLRAVRELRIDNPAGPPCSDHALRSRMRPY